MKEIQQKKAYIIYCITTLAQTNANNTEIERVLPFLHHIKHRQRRTNKTKTHQMLHMCVTVVQCGAISHPFLYWRK